MSRAFRAAEQARASGQTDLEVLHLWNALEEARASRDHVTLARVRGRATELRAAGVDEAGALVEASQAALAEVGRGLAPQIEEAPSAKRRARLAAIGWVLVLVLVIAVQVGARVLFDRMKFEPPPVAVVPFGQGNASPQIIESDGLYLVPTDRTPVDLLVRIARATRERYGAPTTVLRPIRSEKPTLDRDRDQIDAVRLIGQLERAAPASAPRAAVIAVTHADMFSSEFSSDRFVFGQRDWDSYGVLSTARMDPRNYGRAADPSLLERRLEKMVLRYFGEFYFGLPRNDNERSVLRKSIRGLGDIDEMTRNFCPDRPAAIAGC